MFSRMRAVKYGGMGLTAALGSSYAYCATYHERDMEFWRHMLVPVIHYRILDRVTRTWSDSDRDATFAPLHDKYVPIVESFVRAQRGLHIKTAQLVSNRADVLPKQYLDMCLTFQDECPTQCVDGDELRHMVAQSLNVASIDDVYREFDSTPFSSASIGQVHRAVLHDGTTVAVKVQHPDAEAQFRGDLKTQRMFCHIASPVHLPWLNEIEKQFKTEFDYREEAQNLERIRSNVLPHYGHKVAIPRAFMRYTSKNILTMDFITGRKMATVLREEIDTLVAETGTTREALMEELRQRPPLTHGEIRKYNILRTSRWLAESARRVTRNVLTGYGLLAAPVPLNKRPGPLLDIPTLMDLLLEVHGHEMLIDGAFNGDPHGGNILICPDGKLGLIDYGQVKVLSDDKRKKIAQLIRTLVDDNDDSAAVARVCKDTGMLTTTKMDTNPEYIHKRLEMMLNYDDLETTENLNVQLYLEKLDAVDPLLFVDDDFIMPNRLSFMMRGMGFALNYPLRTAERWYPLATRALEKL
eukprot:GEMP01013764.1.p1 GENE.GEMP01013764.1~~GEMP01013764.1.p1  ORF type:complete len:525 (+),score=146.93 GEMP01013764.1:168-1742(+)